MRPTDTGVPQSERARVLVRSRLVEMFAGCNANPQRFLDVTDVPDKDGRMRRLTNNKMGGHDVTLHGRTIHGSRQTGQGGLQVLLDALLMTEDSALRLALLGLLALVSDHPAAGDKWSENSV